MRTQLRFYLRPHQRLQWSWEFRKIREQGKRISVGCLVLNWFFRGDDKPARLGVIATRKIGGAVKRNRAKRLLREAFRLWQHHLKPGYDLVLITKKGIEHMSLEQVQKDFIEAIQQAGIWQD